MAQFVVYCEEHKDYLVVVSVLGTTWTGDVTKARRYSTELSARAAAKQATWRDHRPIALEEAT